MSSKAASESPVSPPSTSSLTSSPPPVYADNELENDGKNTITQSKTAATSITVLISGEHKNCVVKFFSIYLCFCIILAIFSNL